MSFIPSEIRRGEFYKRAEGQSLTADLYLPDAEGTRPIVVVVHGGGWVSRTGDMEGICRSLSDAGFVAVNITYRLAPRNHFPAAVEDVRDAVRWVRENAAGFRGDPNRIAGWGYSAGGNLVLLAGLDPGCGFRALVSGGTPADLTVWPKSSQVRRFLGQEQKENPALWKKASPAFQVRADSPPVFLYHGRWDLIVNIQQYRKMQRALQMQGVPHESYVAPLLGHFSAYVLDKECRERGIEFLRKRL